MAKHLHPIYDHRAFAASEVVPVECDGEMRMCAGGHRHCARWAPVGSLPCDRDDEIREYLNRQRGVVER